MRVIIKIFLARPKDPVRFEAFHTFSSQKVFIKLLCESQFPHKFVNLFFIIANIKNELMDLRRNLLLHNDFYKHFLLDKHVAAALAEECLKAKRDQPE